MIKKIIKIAIIVLIIIIIIFVLARYGWRLFGFNACTNPDSIGAIVEIKENRIVLNGGTMSSAPAFVGYIYKVVDDNLYIGIKYNFLFGFFDRIGDFHIEIKCNTEEINKIYFKDGSTEKLIWEKDE